MRQTANSRGLGDIRHDGGKVSDGDCVAEPGDSPIESTAEPVGAAGRGGSQGLEAGDEPVGWYQGDAIGLKGEFRMTARPRGIGQAGRDGLRLGGGVRRCREVAKF